MTKADFEVILDIAIEELTKDVRASAKHYDPLVFQEYVREVLREVAEKESISIAPTFHPHAFPDIRANGFGVEVKSVKTDSWLSVGNSIFEGMRDKTVQDIYVIFAKLGGVPEVRWGRYAERVTHVRISHAPRFVLEMDRDSSLFGKMNIEYDQFSTLTPEAKMKHVREYSRNRLKPGERLWWLEDENSPGMEIQVRLYMKLPSREKIRLRAEGAIVCPQLLGGSHQKEKYNDVAFYFLKHHNVFCPQTRDLYTAGSVAGKERGGNYLKRSLKSIEYALREAALTLPEEVIEEYWGGPIPTESRIGTWLHLADKYAKNWVPSEHHFQND